MPRLLTDRDCRDCGACCMNPDENRAEGFEEYVAVSEREPLLQDERLVRRFVVTNDAGEHHLRMDHNGRCLALRGTVGRRCECSIYALRPAGCRKIEPESERCYQYRREQGIDR